MEYLMARVLVALNSWMFWEVLGLRQKLKEEGPRLDAQRKSLLLSTYNAQYRSAQQWLAIGARIGCEALDEPMTDFPSFEEWVGMQQ